MYSVKGLVDSGFHQSAIPSKFIIASSSQEDDTVLSQEEAIPTIDFSLLTSGDPDQRSKVIQDIGNACRDWGFFMVINHGVQEKLMDDMVKASKSFFDMSEEEKGEYNGKQLFDPIRSGTSFNVLDDKSLFWRDYLKVHVHPHVNSPNKPACYRLLEHSVAAFTRVLDEASVVLLFRDKVYLHPDKNRYIQSAGGPGTGSDIGLIARNVPPAILLRFLREHRSEWADNSIDAYLAAAVKVGPCILPRARAGSFGGQVILPLAHTIEHEELLEVIKLEGVGHYPEDAIMPRVTCFSCNDMKKEISQEYCKRARDVASELLKGISMSLGLEENYIDKAMEVEFGSQLLVVNFYPPCPQPELAIGMPPHSDHGLLTLLIQNQLGGLQVLHNGKWVPINPLPNSILVNTGDHMEILTNGKYKSVVHRAMVNNKANRISIATSHGPPLDKVVSPAQELVDTDFHPIAYHGITYRGYLELQQSNELNGKSCLDRIRV
ncbi:unnamed protein product [Camellia sinensis]